MNYKIKYGVLNNNIDVTNIVLDKCVKNNIIHIPKTDIDRAKIFTDPLVGVLKKIFIENVLLNKTVEYQEENIFIDIINDKTYTNDVPVNILNIFVKENIFSVRDILLDIQKKLKLDYGSFNDEFPEQLMATKYLTGNEKILEIGGNIGRNSLIIGYILNKNNNNNFVSLESDTNISEQLIHNRNINNLSFHVENSALSKRKLIQQGWNTICSDVLLNGYTNVNTITLEQLNKKYNIVFDTLVLDCEGAFYYILMDMPEILNNIKLIIMENDYTILSHKIYIDNILKANNFYVDHTESGGWGPCYNNFFEVWKK